MHGPPRDTPPSEDDRVDRTDSRYASFELSDGNVVIYDAEDNCAWIQSDDPVALGEMA